MAVQFLTIRSRQPYADGAEFGTAGAYERLDGTAGFAVDPDDPANAAIVDLDLAPRDGAGKVLFTADFCLLQPVDPARGNRRLLFEVVNRGRKLVPRMFNHAPAELVPGEGIDPGDGFLLQRGWTVAWCGWQWDVLRSGALMGMEAPRAQQHGRPVAGQVSVQVQPNSAVAHMLLADRVHAPYPAADLEDATAELSVREWRDGPRTLIPRERWRFARDIGGRPVLDAACVRLEGGFEPGRLYEVVYQTAECPVVGTGLLAIRDAAAFLRYAEGASGNPCVRRLDHAYGVGMSQSGRFLRHFLYLGLNVDETGRRVFDGLLPHVAGARCGEFNQRFGQPSVQASPGFGNLPPFASNEQTDPATGRSDGLFRRQREVGGMPRVVATNTSAEYWRGDCSLVHTDLVGRDDVEPAPEERIYLFAGTQHGPGTLPLATVNAVDGAQGRHGFNAVDYVPLLRAALVNLDRWVSDGVEPPPSRFPRLADGSAVPADAALAAFRAIPGTTLPEPGRVPVARRVELGVDADRGVGRYPVRLGEPYSVFVSAVDADGNELGGIQTPDVAVPVATYTGWNPRDPAIGGDGQILSMLGSTLPFPITASERARTGDPRPAIAERYSGRDDYLARVQGAAAQLVADGYLLEEDCDLAVDLAAARYDAFAPVAATVGGRT